MVILNKRKHWISTGKNKQFHKIMDLFFEKVKFAVTYPLFYEHKDESGLNSEL